MHWFEPSNIMGYMPRTQEVVGRLDEILKAPKWTQILGENSLPVSDLYEGLLHGHGWNTLQHDVLPQHQLEKILHEKVFDWVFTMPEMCKVRLGEYLFVERLHRVDSQI